MTKVLFGGCFDLLHMGHALAIYEAKKHGDELIIQLASDEEIRAKKGMERPIIPEEERRFMVAQLPEVSHAFIWRGKHDPRGIIELIKPDVLILNTDSSYFIEPQLAKEHGFKIVYIPRFVPPSGLDTTKIIEKINGHR